MSASVFDTILLGTDAMASNLDGFSVITPDNYEEAPMPAMSIERSLTGQMHIHRVQSGGSTLAFGNWRPTIIATHAEKRALAALVGETLYFWPNYRDETDPDTYRHVVVMKSVSSKEIDPMLGWWRVTLDLESADGNTP
jgi:hypothetical protein